MRFISSIKKLNYKIIFDKTIECSLYTGTLTGTAGGIHAAYIFSPDKSNNFTYNSIYLILEVLKYTGLYGYGGLIGGLIWPISMPCLIINTVKYIKNH